MNAKVFNAIFSRNFISYFSSPTGYVFITVFVLLSSFAAFWPDEFWNANLANLDQLNIYMPAILLIFIPAITMSIWAEERRQGTDELLLTIPATDLDVVLGKFAAALAIYTVALLFSLVTNAIVLFSLGWPDLGLLFSTYLGYWMMGMAMLAVGMVASFLTSNLTVAFILGALFNAPFVGAQFASSFATSSEFVAFVKEWSFLGQFRDFGRGVLSLSSTAYFISIAAVMLYVCMVLIGRRHWAGGPAGNNLFTHYLVRSLSAFAMALGFNMAIRHVPAHYDVTQERISTLSPQTREVLADLDPKRPVKVDAYISPIVPDEYVETQLNLRSFLREFERLGNGKIKVAIHEVEPGTEEAVNAETTYGIKPRSVLGKERGVYRQQPLFLGVAFRSGLEKVVVPFLESYQAVEYELARSVRTVNQTKRKKIGLLFGTLRDDGQESLNEEGEDAAPPGMQRMVDELKRQYEVVVIKRPNQIEQDFSVLVAVQPSMLEPRVAEQLRNVIASGRKTVIFEDPYPQWFANIQATSAPKMNWRIDDWKSKNSPQEWQDMRANVAPESSINQIWELAGIDLKRKRSAFDLGGSGRSEPAIIWQQYNPHPKIDAFSFLPREWIFVDNAEPGAEREAFNQGQPISSNLKEILFPAAGALDKRSDAAVTFIPLVRTGTRSGVISYGDFSSTDFMTNRGITHEESAQQRQGMETIAPDRYVLSARVQIKAEAPSKSLLGDAPEPAQDGSQPPAAKIKAKQIAFQTKGGSKETDTAPPGGEKPASDEANSNKADSNKLDSDKSGTDNTESAEGAKESKPEQTPQAVADAPGKAAPSDAQPDAKSDGAKTESPKAAEGKTESAPLGDAQKGAAPTSDGKLPELPPAEGVKPARPKKKRLAHDVDLVVVADIDLMHDEFFRIRAEQGGEIAFNFDNITFVLNIVDELSGDDRYIAIRKKRPEHRPLEKIEQRLEAIRSGTMDFVATTRKNIDAEQKSSDRRVMDLQSQESKAIAALEKENASPGKIRETQIKLRAQAAVEKREAEAKMRRYVRDAERNIEARNRETLVELRSIQDSAKRYAVLLPPIPPLLLAFAVYFHRRAREREGVSRSRLR